MADTFEQGKELLGSGKMWGMCYVARDVQLLASAEEL